MESGLRNWIGEWGVEEVNYALWCLLNEMLQV